LTRDDALQRIHDAGVEPREEVIVLGIRGYRHDDHAHNKRNLWDDCIAIIGPQHFSAYSANTDPSIFRPGIATLALGVHRYRPGWHRKGRQGGHPAFRPATKNEELPVMRDGVKVPWPGIAINIHRGGINSTSSEGCITIPPLQWDAFYASLMDQLRRANQAEFRYILIQ